MQQVEPVGHWQGNTAVKTYQEERPRIQELQILVHIFLCT